MNSPAQSGKTTAGSRRFILEMIAFPEAEKAMLATTFRLTGRRVFFYTEAAEATDRIDIYLVNADNPEALAELQTRSPNNYAPAVLIGRSSTELAWPRVEKPIHWMRLFEQLDASMQGALLERAKRQHTRADAGVWDGRTYRRAIDKDTPPEEVFIEAKPM